MTKKELGQAIASKTAERDALEADFCAPCRMGHCGACGIGQEIDHMDALLWSLNNRRDLAAMKG